MGPILRNASRPQGQSLLYGLGTRSLGPSLPCHACKLTIFAELAKKLSLTQYSHGNEAKDRERKGRMLIAIPTLPYHLRGDGVEAHSQICQYSSPPWAAESQQQQQLGLVFDRLVIYLAIFEFPGEVFTHAPCQSQSQWQYMFGRMHYAGGGGNNYLVELGETETSWVKHGNQVFEKFAWVWHVCYDILFMNLGVTLSYMCMCESGRALHPNEMDKKANVFPTLFQVQWPFTSQCPSFFFLFFCVSVVGGGRRARDKRLFSHQHHYDRDRGL